MNFVCCQREKLALLILKICGLLHSSDNLSIKRILSNITQACDQISFRCSLLIVHDLIELLDHRHDDGERLAAAKDGSGIGAYRLNRDGITCVKR